MRIGIDLGGTKIAAVALADDGEPRWQRRIVTPRHDYAGTLDAVVSLVRDGETAVGGPCTVGVGMPGTISPATGLVKNANSTWLNGRAFRQDLQRALDREVRCANDANCLAVSEAADGAAAGARVVFGAILGTGVGGGIVVDGVPLVGANAIGGEWGHNPLPWPDEGEAPVGECYCGLRGCIETYLSGPALLENFRARGGQADSAATVAARAAQGEARAVAALDEWHDRLARALATIINVVDPDVIVVGGGLSRITTLYEQVPARWPRWVFSDSVVTRIVPAAHGDASGVRGAAWLWPVGPSMLGS